ncbi:MAG: ABC transporter substrate-binding protein [Thermoleophilaceae bacterium]|nr:ABC transporter substrate-binding protein [Thermoleophilaceae bacterium]
MAAAAALPAWALSACGATSEPTSGGGSAGGKEIKIGFIALTDCAPIIMADTLGYFKERGLNVSVVKQASWPATRDALLNGDIDAAHCLYSLPLAGAAGLGGQPANDKLKIAMTLSNNGQAITLKDDLSAAGYGDLNKAKAAINGGKGQTFAMTFPGGTHDAWLRYWLLAMGVSMDAAKIIPIPPPQMVANMTAGNMNGYSVGEPWNAVAVDKKIGFTTIASQDIWTNHPEKALVVNEEFATKRQSELKEVMAAVLDACQFCDDEKNIPKVAKTIGTPAIVNATPEDIEPRLLGEYELGAGLGHKSFGARRMRFFRDGETNVPRAGEAIWFLAQYQRFGYLDKAPAYDQIAESVILSDLYADVAKSEGVKVPDDGMAPFTVKLDNTHFDPKDPQKEADRA